MSPKKRGLKIFVIVLLSAGLCAAFYAWKTISLQRDYREAMRLYDRKQYQEAAPALRNVYRKSPSSDRGIRALYGCCISLEAQGKRQEADACWRLLLSNSSAGALHARALLALACSETAENRLGEAERNLNEFFEKYPSSPLAGQACLLRALLLERKGDLQGALRSAREAADKYPGCGVAGQARRKAGELRVALLFSPQIVPGTEEYVVERGDSLQSIAKKYDTTVELLEAMNKAKIGKRMLHPGDRLKVCAEKFSVLVDKSANTLTLKSGEEAVKVYSVGTGKKGSTPVGDFTIINKIKKPEWFKPGGGVVPYGDPENVLGTRWMGIDYPGYGIHGTWEPESIGKQASAGCIRMLNNDVEELYTIVPAGTKVKIVD